ncbi:putative transaldolase 1 [Lasius niger]|uniref:Putative transaldolase 1 n=1 Tax=Lasius niger TaxID=67767 RepID=A0A0J7NHY5_LASNI|nr:putative transaldolase 1 [Lasius niger]
MVEAVRIPHHAWAAQNRTKLVTRIASPYFFPPWTNGSIASALLDRDVAIVFFDFDDTIRLSILLSVAAVTFSVPLDTENEEAFRFLREYGFLDDIEGSLSTDNPTILSRARHCFKNTINCLVMVSLQPVNDCRPNITPAEVRTAEEAEPSNARVDSALDDEPRAVEERTATDDI